MMKSMKKRCILSVLIICITLSGCHASSVEPLPGETETPAETPGGGTETPTEIPGGGTETPAVNSTSKTAMLYIGTVDSGFTQYPMEYEGELTPEILIQGISGLTGWNLTLAEIVTSGKGGMSVCFSDESALFTGPPEPQKEEFHMYDAGQLSQTILDSIQKTLQMGFTGEGGNPDALDIYYYMEGERPLELPDLEISWPIDEPYRWPDTD